ncbi:hypothetical protein [Bradyrhizobium sp. LHD-71]|uniref:hypothetical protein n=1 Tax=Bradyrhizobium sp. LHD-71 TaxID=3072141 RepID=UPI00280C7847|nr:hypothetical protein [Bradyrhizobium sp. LHD-71]MDQ8730547.1 hypothetical protein [Bradyrhizobium sp. LHD-71]
MERADLYRVFDLGGALRGLTTIKQGDPLSKIYLPMVNAQSALNQLLGTSPQAQVDLCKEAARGLKNVVDRIDAAHFMDGKGNFKYPDDAAKLIIAPWLAWEVEAAYQNFEAVFRAEMQAASTYWVPKRGAYSTRDLVDAFDRSFLPELHASIGEKALSEYRNAGRCFAFGLWSAAGYHACRAVEAVLRPYYCFLLKKKDNEARTWGDLIKDLREKSDEPKASEKALFYLQQLKDNERNPLMHVRVVLEEIDADMLLNSSKIAIGLMANHLKIMKQDEPTLGDMLVEAPAKLVTVEISPEDEQAA